MSININLIGDSLPVDIDERTLEVGGSFWYTNPPRVYSPYIHKWAYKQLCQHARAVLIDVGASSGCYGLLAKHHPDLTVHAFEPLPYTYDVLKANMELNGIADKVNCYQLAVSDYDGVGVFHIVEPRDGSGVSMLDGRPRDDKHFFNIGTPVMTLDAFCEQHGVIPTMVKIDVEGNELAVLRGAEKTIRTYHPTLIVEDEPLNTQQYDYAPAEIKALLEGWKYALSNPFGGDIVGIYKGNE